MNICKYLLALFIITGEVSVLPLILDYQGSPVAGLGRLITQNLPP